LAGHLVAVGEGRTADLTNLAKYPNKAKQTEPNQTTAIFSQLLPHPHPQTSSRITTSTSCRSSLTDAPLRDFTMAADIGHIAQLLNATLDPAQHRKGELSRWPLRFCPAACSLVVIRY